MKKKAPKKTKNKLTSVTKGSAKGGMGKGYGDWKTAPGSKNWQYPLR